MIGLVYTKADNNIIARIENIQSYTSNSITGLESAVRGIDLTKADFVIVDDLVTLKEEDILGVYTDIRNQLPKTELELLKERVAINQDTIDYRVTSVETTQTEIIDTLAIAMGVTL